MRPAARHGHARWRRRRGCPSGSVPQRPRQPARRRDLRQAAPRRTGRLRRLPSPQRRLTRCAAIVQPAVVSSSSRSIATSGSSSTIRTRLPSKIAAASRADSRISAEPHRRGLAIARLVVLRQRQTQPASDAVDFVADRGLAAIQFERAFDQSRAEAVRRRARGPASTPSSRHEIRSSGSVVSTRQSMVSRPFGVDSAPYFRALVASSWRTSARCTEAREVEYHRRTRGRDAQVRRRSEQHLLADDVGDVGALHLALDEKVMGAGERMDAPAEARHEVGWARRAAERLVGDRLDRWRACSSPDGSAPRTGGAAALPTACAR